MSNIAISEKMNNDTSKKKELVINNVLYAHYLIENKILYLKIRKNIIKDDKKKSEDYLIDLISLIERKKVAYAAYLNIK